MKNIKNLFLFFLISVGFVFSIISCQSNNDVDTENVDAQEVVAAPLGLVEDEDGNVHLPLDFAKRYPLLADLSAREQRLNWFDNNVLGVYIDMGLHSHIGREFQGKGVNDSEWMLCVGQIPPADYEAMAKTLDLSEFDIDAFVKKVVALGVGYVVLNAKHFDGFSMFDSAYTDYDIIDATDKKYDIYAKLVPALKNVGIKVGFHYSIMDWNHPSQANFNDKGEKQVVDFMTTIDPEKKDEYIAYVQNQISELITNYQADMIWFDGAEWLEWWSSIDGWNLQTYILKKNPNVIVNDRIGKMTKFDGDFTSFNQRHAASLSKYYRAWETHFKVATSFGYSRKQRHSYYKTFLRKYIDAASRDGNLLVKISVDSKGNLEKHDAESLDEVSEIIAENQLFFNSVGSAPKRFWSPNSNMIIAEWRRFVVKDNTLYLVAYYNPGSKKIKIPEMEGKVYTKAYYYNDPTSELEILNMDEVLEERAERISEMREDLLDSKNNDSDDDSEDVLDYDVAVENSIFGYSDDNLEDDSYENVELLRVNWPDEKIVIIAIDFKDLSDDELLEIDFEKREKAKKKEKKEAEKKESKDKESKDSLDS